MFSQNITVTQSGSSAGGSIPSSPHSSGSGLSSKGSKKGSGKGKSKDKPVEMPHIPGSGHAEADQRRTDRIDFSEMELNGEDVSHYTLQKHLSWLIYNLTQAVDDEEMIEKTSADYDRRIHLIEQELSRMNPNLRAGTLLEELDKKLDKET